MVTCTQSIEDFTIGEQQLYTTLKSLETSMREEDTRILKQKPNLEYKKIMRKIKTSKNKSGKRVTCFISLTCRLLVIDEAHIFLKNDHFKKFVNDAHKTFSGKVSK